MKAFDRDEVSIWFSIAINGPTLQMSELSRKEVSHSYLQVCPICNDLRLPSAIFTGKMHDKRER